MSDQSIETINPNEIYSAGWKEGDKTILKYVNTITDEKTKQKYLTQHCCVCLKQINKKHSYMRVLLQNDKEKETLYNQLIQRNLKIPQIAQLIQQVIKPNTKIKVSETTETTDSNTDKYSFIELTDSIVVCKKCDLQHTKFFLTTMNEANSKDKFFNNYEIKYNDKTYYVDIPIPYNY